MDTYFAQLSQRVEAMGRLGALSTIETVYIGGGTPSLAGERLVRLAARICGHCDPVEFTCEANPESMDASLARALADAGVTRISLGVQSLNAVELRAIGRIHTAERALAAVGDCRAAGLDVSCDLMCGLPGQTAASWRSTLERALEAGPDHISIYPLALEEGTPLYRAAARDERLEPDEDFQADCMDAAREFLMSGGYGPYEVASYAKPGHACAHNIAYWTGRGYLGLGRSAAGMLSREDFDALASLFPGVEPPDTAARVRLVQLGDAAGRFDAECLSARQAAAEDLMLGFRLTRGVDAGLLRRSCSNIPRSELAAACDRAVELGLAQWTRPGGRAAGELSAADVLAGSMPVRLAPTHLGWLDGNVLFELFWDLAEPLV